MAQKCVFCGGVPEKKNKEHVIPQWLSKYLGRYKSVCNLGWVTDAKIPFSGLTFPACTECNSEDADLEAQAKLVIENLMDSKPVTGIQVSILMDWFDKLRTGIWLGELMLSKRLDEIDPNYYINDRIALKDRMLIIERFDITSKGLGLTGINTQMFIYSPNVFQLWMHNVLITNASATGIIDGKLGFPHIHAISKTEQKKFIADVLPGRNKTTHPVIMNLDGLNKTVVYQPVFKEYKSTPYCDTPYVHNHSYDYDAGVGGIFIQKHNNEIKYINPTDKINLMPKLQPESQLQNSHRRVYELQKHVFEKVNKPLIETPTFKQEKNLSLCEINAIIKSLSR